MFDMLRKKLTVIAIVLLILTTGCSGLTQQSNSTQTNLSPETSTNEIADQTDGENNSNKIIKDRNYTAHFTTKLNYSPINIHSISRNERTIRVKYIGKFNNKSKTTSEVIYIITRFSSVLNSSYNNKSNWNVSQINIVGMAPNGSVVWDTSTEDWWAMKYTRSHWDIRSYLTATANAGEYWNISTAEPPSYGDRYISKLKKKLQRRTDTEVLSLNARGAEAFLTYETDRELNSTRYFDQVANVTDVYKNLTLPRRFNRTDGWYAGVLNIEVRNGNDTLEWYRYQIRWAEARVEGEMSRQEEAYRLRQSRFLEKDRLRDEPATGE